MDRTAEKLATWFGSTPFITFHFVWFTVWIILHMTTGWDEDWSTLTLVVSLEAIFLSLFILRAENIQAERFERQVKKDVKNTKAVLDKLDKRKKNS